MALLYYVISRSAELLRYSFAVELRRYGRLVLLAAMTTETVGVILIGGAVAIVSLYLMIFTDVMFGKHRRSAEWDEFLHQPPKPPQD